MITNGDGFTRGTAAITGMPRDELTPEDYLKLAEIRQRQSEKGLVHIGMKKKALTF